MTAKLQTIRPVLYTFLIVLACINLLLVINRGMNLAETTVFASNLAPTTKPEVAGTEVKVIAPHSLGYPAPTLSAAGVIVLDVDSGEILFQKNPDKRLPIASTTKIMTALVASEYFQPNQLLIVGSVGLEPGSTMGLKLGEQLTFRSLLYGMLLNSGNDAAFTLAANYPGGVEGFINKMNQKAQELNLKNTHFTNPAGFDNPEHYSSASDLAKIALSAQSNPQIARVVSTKDTVVASSDKTVVHQLKNVNQLLNIPGVIGIKTGYTDLAKENLVAEIQRENHSILTVVLGSDDRFGETKNLMDWSFLNYVWQ